MSKQILIIEDNEQNMYMLTYLLECSGYEVLQSYSGEDGITSAAKTTPYAVLLDIQLPEMDGYTVAVKLRENKKLSAVPIIAVTSFAMMGDKERVLASGADGYIEKPIDPDNFIAEMEAVISQKRNS
ncbi:MAG: response regulator [Ignavibacteriaceae bacterium]|nr:response regulator [Ignavibacteriaceae bacterium]